MRTTLDIEDDLLQAMREIADHRGLTAGRVASELIRKALEPSEATPRVRNGVPVLPRRRQGPIMTMKLVNELRDE